MQTFDSSSCIITYILTCSSTRQSLKVEVTFTLFKVTHIHLIMMSHCLPATEKK